MSRNAAARSFCVRSGALSGFLKSDAPLGLRRLPRGNELVL
ncbi:hypothetical protein HMPREF1155_0582 [Slackia sp. CM382]|nr:hypothetical protein HMPREF1155_0582 [Slackia sp. CM382]